MFKDLMKIITMALILALLPGCGDKNHKSDAKLQVITARASAGVSHLYYEGHIVPAAPASVTSQVDGTVNHLEVHYGDTVKQNQLLLTINSPQLAEEFRNIISNYFQRKTNYHSAEENFKASTALHKAGVISGEEYLNATNNYHASSLDYFQARQQLRKVLVAAQLERKEIESLDLKNTEEVKQLLARDFNELRVVAPAAGVVLMPQANGASHEFNPELNVGAAVKAGQVLFQLANLNQLGVAIEVTEADVNRIKVHDKAVITGLGFPEHELNAEVIEVAAQAQVPGNNGSDLSLFKVILAVVNIPKDAAKKIHIGMTAKVDLLIKQPAVVKLPLTAVNTKGGRSTVEKIEQQSHLIKQVPVKTGETSVGEVSILQGVNPGDQVVIHE